MQQIFKRLGCSSTQATLYLQLYSLGPSIASILSKRSNIKRVTVYGALDGLVQKGLVELLKKNGVSYYQAVDPSVLINLLEIRLLEEEQFVQRARKIIQLAKQKQKTQKELYKRLQ